MLRTIVEAFMHILKMQYLKMIEDAIYIHHVNEGEMLLQSIVYSQDISKIDVCDFNYVVKDFEFSGENVNVAYNEYLAGNDDDNVRAKRRKDTIWRRIGESSAFEIFYLLVILINVVFIYVEV